MSGITLWQFVILAVAILFCAIVTVLVYGEAAVKAGYSRWRSLLLLIPFVNIIVVWMFAFAKWPAELSHNNALERPNEG